MYWNQLLSHPEIVIPSLALCIPIVAILMSGITGIVKLVIAHRERMAMIQQGLDPDRSAEEIKSEDDPAVAG